MKKALLFGLGLFSSFNLFAQDLSVNEAILFAQDNYTGTARYHALSGAFGALGGDLSAISTNPAGSTVFANNQLGISINNNNVRNHNTYLNQNFNSSKNNLNIGEIGGVFIFQDTSKTNDWKKLVIGLTYESSNKFNNDILAVGKNQKTNLGEYFASLANNSGFSQNDFIIQNNETLEDRYIYFGDGIGSQNFGYHSQLAFMGYNSYLISASDPTNLNDTNFVSNTSSTNNYYHEKSILSSGEAGKITANIAFEYKDVVSLGLNLNNHFTKYNRLINIIESNPNISTNGYNYANFETYISTIGNGFSFNLGLLTKINNLRLGAGFQSSTWYTFSEEFYHRISFKAVDQPNRPEGTIDPNVIITLPSYKLQTPNKTTFSLAYIFGKRGLISLDCGIKNYSKIKYKPGAEPDFRAINTKIEQQLQNTIELRGGAEYRIENISLRGGLQFHESPYKNTNIQIGNFYQASAGLGYSFGPWSINASYSKSIQTFYDHILQQGLTNKYRTVAKNNIFTCTLVIEM